MVYFAAWKRWWGIVDGTDPLTSRPPPSRQTQNELWDCFKNWTDSANASIANIVKCTGVQLETARMDSPFEYQAPILDVLGQYHAIVLATNNIYQTKTIPAEFATSWLQFAAYHHRYDIVSRLLADRKTYGILPNDDHETFQKCKRLLARALALGVSSTETEWRYDYDYASTIAHLSVIAFRNAPENFLTEGRQLVTIIRDATINGMPPTYIRDAARLLQIHSEDVVHLHEISHHISTAMVFPKLVGNSTTPITVQISMPWPYIIVASPQLFDARQRMMMTLYMYAAKVTQTKAPQGSFVPTLSNDNAIVLANERAKDKKQPPISRPASLT